MSDTNPAYEIAIEDFLERVQDADLKAVDQLILFGSVARANHTPESDIDVLAVLDADADKPALEERLRDIAYDVMLEHGTVFSIHAVTESTLEHRSDHPFFRTVLSEGRAIYG